jgi:Tat protein secretion system quality control protein TatD with DNase activity
MHCHLGQAAEPVPDGPVVLAVSITPDEWLDHRDDAGPPGIVWALGLHPWTFVSSRQLDRFLELLPECDAVGEIGVDGTHRPLRSVAEQREGVATILAHPETKRRIVTIHGFDAYGDVIDLLEADPTPGIVYHWFMGAGAVLDRAIALDIFFSVNDAMLASLAGPEIVAELPRDRVLVETDAPCIQAGTGIPMNPGDPPVAGGPALRPGQLSATELALARIWGTTRSEVRAQLWRNLAELEGRVERRPFDASAVLAVAEVAT